MSSRREARAVKVVQEQARQALCQLREVCIQCGTPHGRGVNPRTGLAYVRCLACQAKDVARHRLAAMDRKAQGLAAYGRWAR